MSNRRDEEGQGFERSKKAGDGRLFVREWTGLRSSRIGWQSAYLNKKVEHRLEDIDGVPEVVIEHKRVVGDAAALHEMKQVTWRKC